MAAVDFPLCSRDKTDEDETPDSDILRRFRLLEHPILVLVCFHKALVAELAQLRLLAETLSLEDKSKNTELIHELQQRFEFLKLAYKCHCAAEDEVIFCALDVHMKEVLSTYVLEHKLTDDLFESIFHCLNELKEGNEDISKLLQEFFYCLDTTTTSICQHMKEEEEQVFTSLMQQFSLKEQALLVWQFLCSVPVIFLEKVLPWMISFLSVDQQAEVMQCLKEIAPKEKLVQEVLVSWVGSDNQVYNEPYCKNEQSADGSTEIEKSQRLQLLETDNVFHQCNVLHLWHAAIRKDLGEILKETQQIRNGNFQNLDTIVIQSAFLADVLIFYGKAQERFFCSVLNELDIGWLVPSTERFGGENHVEGLQRFLFNNNQNQIPLYEFLDQLCKEIEAFVSGVSKQFSFQETKVFPVISKNTAHGTLERLLYMSLHMMPLGLLKCVVTWFSSHLSEYEYRSFLYGLKQGYHPVHKSFSALLYEWFRIGYSGKTSTEKFHQEFKQISRSRFSFLSEQIKKVDAFSFLNSDTQSCKKVAISVKTGDCCLSTSSSSEPQNLCENDMPYSSIINLCIFFPGMTKTLHSHPGDHAEKSKVASVLNDPKPIDLIFFFHMAIKKDLDYLVFGSALLNENALLLRDFSKRFHLIRFIYQVQSDAEDELAFPALEAKDNFKNISLLYNIDHTLDFQYLSRISLILDDLSELHLSVSNVDSKTQGQNLMKHHQLCKELHELCTSVHNLLSHYISLLETEIWPSFREFLSNEEQERIIGFILGRTGTEILQDMVPWLMESFTPEEQHVLMFLWSMVTRNTMFDEWLGEWWEGYRIAKVPKELNDPPSWNVDPLEIISKYFSEDVLSKLQGQASDNKIIDVSFVGATPNISENYNVKGKDTGLNRDQDDFECSHSSEPLSGSVKVANVTSQIDIKGQPVQACIDSNHNEQFQTISQEDMEMAIRSVSRDSSLDPERKSYIIQNLLMSHWIVKRQIFNSGVILGDGQEFLGQEPSFKDPGKQIFGCKHYKRNCKIFAPCCNQLHTCIRCHDEETDHSIDRKSITKMMCMKCLVIQPISATCSTVSCNNLSMARYYCKICRLFEDAEREIYHCPYCNLCRVGKGLSRKYFHCMKCNACMSCTLSAHKCREKCMEENCPICHEYIFTSCDPVKALPCSHLMHTACFEVYTSTNYTCPICSKSLGDMQVYFKMLDALLAEEKLSDEFPGQNQVILCNDCEKEGAAPFHWLYHKCPFCGSYNTRLI